MIEFKNGLGVSEDTRRRHGQTVAGRMAIDGERTTPGAGLYVAWASAAAERLRFSQMNFGRLEQPHHYRKERKDCGQPGAKNCRGWQTSRGVYPLLANAGNHYAFAFVEA